VFDEKFLEVLYFIYENREVLDKIKIAKAIKK